jgi:hypothetical protein
MTTMQMRPKALKLLMAAQQWNLEILHLARVHGPLRQPQLQASHYLNINWLVSQT